MKASNAISSKTDAQATPSASAASSSRTVERFTLKGPSAELDPLYHAYRGDLADVALASRLFAPHYVAPQMRTVTKSTHLLKQANGESLAPLSVGDGFAMLDESGGWIWGYRVSDHMVGYVPADVIG